MDERKNKKIRQKIIFAAIFVTLAVIAEIYIVMKVTFYPFIFAIILAVLEVVAMYFLVDGVLDIYDIKNKERNEQYQNTIKSQKASYILQKRYFESLEERMSVLEKVAVLPTEEIVTAQKGIAKVIINRNRENTEATLNSHEQIIDMLGEFEKQLNQNNAGLVERLNENNAGLVEQEKALNAESIQQMISKQQEIIMSLKDMEIRMNNAIMQSQKVISAQVPVYTTPVTPMAESGTNVQKEPVLMEEEIIPEEPVLMEEEIIPEEPVLMEEEIIPEEAELMEEKPPMPDLSDPNKKMNPDEIAALFANLGENSESLEEPVEMEEEIIPEEAELMEEKPPMPDLSDPNKKMSPDEIAALFANLS